MFKAKFLELYSDKKFNFPINNNLLSNIITKWKNTTNRFNKSTVWDNIFYYQNRLILREFRSVYKQPETNVKFKYLEYIIWGNEENLKRIRKPKHFKKKFDGAYINKQDFLNSDNTIVKVDTMFQMFEHIMYYEDEKAQILFCTIILVAIEFL